MKTNICLISTLRTPFRSLLLLILFGFISFGFLTKAVGFTLVQRETAILGSYYRSIGVLENAKDSTSNDVFAGVEMIETSPHFAYGDQRRVVSGIMPETYNSDIRGDSSNNSLLTSVLPQEDWPNVHNTDIWFTGVLNYKEPVNADRRSTNKKLIGYYLNVQIDTLFAAYPEDARQGQSIGLLFLFKGNSAAIPLIEEMEVGKRYFLHAWKDIGFQLDISWENVHAANFHILPLDRKDLWYIPLSDGETLDFSTPEMASIKNEIDLLNENLCTLGIIATTDMSAMPRTQEASRFYTLAQGRWLNHQDDLAGNKVIVVSEEFASMRGFQLGDTIPLTFRPLKDTFRGYIRDGEDQLAWKSYPTYQDTFQIVGIYDRVSCCAFYAYIPTSSLQPGFESETKFREEDGYSFVLDSARNETEFLQTYKAPLQKLGINLTFLENNGPAYWASVDPIRHASSADLLIFGLLMATALIMLVFLYVMQRRRDYAILRALGVPAKRANRQLILPLFLLGGLGIIGGGLPAWRYALNQAKDALSTIPTPSGVYPSSDLSPWFLAGFCAAIFLLLALFSWLGVLFLAGKPVFEILQGQTARTKSRRMRTEIPLPGGITPPFAASPAGAVVAQASLPGESAANNVGYPRRKYNPVSLTRYVAFRLLRSWVKSLLTFAIALGFLLASGWILWTIEHSRREVDRLYDTTVVEADIIQTNSAISTTAGSGFIFRKTIDRALSSGFVQHSVLEADTSWFKVEKDDAQAVFTGTFPVYAYDSPETLYSGLEDPAALLFAPEWNRERFAKAWTPEAIRQEGVPAIFPKSRLEQWQLRVGEMVKITDQWGNAYPCQIVGQYAGGRVTIVNSVKTRWVNQLGDSILIPLSVLEAMDGSKTKFTAAHFTLDPKKNRELSQFSADMEITVKDYGAGVGELRFLLWDEELRIVIGQLEKNLSLFRLLYPVMLAVSVLIGASLCFLLLLQSAREAAILRVLGTTGAAVRLAFIMELLFLSVLGLVAGLGISWFLWMAPNAVSASSLWTGAVLYLAGVLCGSVAGAIAITRKKPIELLQVKE